MTREEALGLLKAGSEGIAKWNSWRRTAQSEELPDLSGADLSGANMKRADLRGIILRGANMREVNLHGAYLHVANLSGANLHRANLRGAYLREAFLSKSRVGQEGAEEYLSAADLSGADLSGADLGDANLSGARLSMAWLTGANLAKADLQQSYLGPDTLSGYDLSRSFMTPLLSYHELSSEKISRDVYTGNGYLAALEEAGLHQLVLSGRVVLREANLSAANLWRANLYWAILQNANLSGANLVWADLSEADLRGVDLSGADLRLANFNRTDIHAYDGRGADFTESKFVSDRFWDRARDFLALFNWHTVRAVGGLQVLTKASYAMLALVPLLAGAWQGVKLWAAHSKYEVYHAIQDLEQTAQNRQSAAPQTVAQEIDHIRAAAHRLQVMIDRGDMDHTLPSAWAYGYFAALFVVTGHFVYQIRCPELVAAKTPDTFASEQLSGFSATGEDRNDRLTRAIHALKEVAEIAPTRRHRNLIRRHGRVVWIPSESHFLLQEPDVSKANNDEDSQPISKDLEGESERPKLPFISGGPELMRVTIEEGARAEYELSALRDRPAAVVAFLLYTAAGLLITWLVASQSWSVAKAAGWVG